MFDASYRMTRSTCRDAEMAPRSHRDARRDDLRRHATAAHVGGGLATHGLDLINNTLSRRNIASRAVDTAAQVVDNDQCAMLGKT
mgnify:CR=1 FL=1